MLQNHGIDFKNTPPSIIPAAPVAAGIGQVWVSAADTLTGSLRFYSNGELAFNRNNQIMPDGFGMGSYGANAQNTCIVPFIGDPNKYYLFTIPGYGLSMSVGGGTVGPGSTPPGGGNSSSLQYSIIDMELDNGLGAVVANQKNILLDEGPFGEMMIAVPGNNCDIWLLVHTVEDATFKAFRITKHGVDTTPVISTLTNAISGQMAYMGGSMAISPNRNYIAIASNHGMNAMGWGIALPGFCGFQIAEFDPNSGMISNNIVLSNSSNAFGVCFSPDNSKVYFSSYNPIPGENCGFISQYDITNFNQAAIVATKYDIPDVGGLLRRRGDTIYTSTMAAYITNPNLAGAACDFQFNPIVSQLGFTLGYSIGNDVVIPPQPDTFRLAPLDTCFMEKITLKAPPGYGNYTWQDGTKDSMILVYESGTYQVSYDDDCHTYIMTIHAEELAEGLLVKDTVLCDMRSLRLDPKVFTDEQVTYSWSDGSSKAYLDVNSSGTYWVDMRFSGGCRFSDSIEVLMIDIAQNLGDDIQICHGDPLHITLQSNTVPGASIIWSTGAITDQITVTDTGTYWVEVTYPPCAGSDTLIIDPAYCGCKTLTPSAFSPNGDGINDYFGPAIESACPVSNYKLSIYNRFGQRVFYSANPSKQWDGRVNGKTCDVGVYFYEVYFEGGSAGAQREYHKQGDLTLLR